MAQVVPTTPTQSVFRLSWLTISFGLLAMAALCAREGSLFSPLPLLAVALLVSRFSAKRLENPSQVWILRGPLFLLVIVLGLFRPFPDTSGLYDPRTICLAAELLAVEMTLQAWRQRPSGGGQGAAIILLSGLILLAAADSTEDRSIWVFAPLYILTLALALPGFRSPSQGRTINPYRRSMGAWIALAIALLLGVSLHVTFRVHRDNLTEWGMQMLHETPTPDAGSGALSTSPTLGPSYGLSGSDERAYRIEGPRGAELPEHLRVMAFDTYAHQSWLPGESARGSSAESARRLPTARPPFWRVTRFLANDGILTAPLETTGFDPLEQRDIRWAPEMGPLKSEAAVPSAYLIAVGPEGTQGFFCTPPDDLERKRLLTLPQELDPKVCAIARDAGSGAVTPEEKAAAVATFLPAHHAYSLSYRPKVGDPISRFLLSNSAAHCEYFASAAAILLRCLGVPARYVIGYYAHERDPGGQIIVRQRDAHAWAEAWIEGKGWMTVDATPGDGRPDRAPAVPWWTRVRERIGDTITSLRGRLGRFGMLVVLTVAAVVGMGIAWRNRPRRDTQGINRALSYARTHEELATLATRFERICRRQGLLLPPNQTWEEAIDELSALPQSSMAASDLEAARDFVRAYTAARWGGADESEIVRLKAFLQALENRPTRRKS